MDLKKKTAKDSSYFQSFGALLKGLQDWSSVLENFPYGLGALMFYFLLYQSELFPSWLSIWGLIGATLLVVMGSFRLFGHSVEFLALPIILNEGVLAVWLIVEGFNSSAISYTVVGVLFIIALVSTIMSGVFLKSIKNPDFLTVVSANEKKVLIGVLLMTILSASVVAIPIIMFPILKMYNESLALGYVIARIFEGIADAAMALSQLLLLTLSREYVKAEAPSVKTYVKKDE